MLVEPSNFCRYTIECQTIHTCMNRMTLNQLLANCQSSVDWDIDRVSAKYRLRCPLSVYGVLSDGVNRHPNCGCFQHTRFEKCILYHTRFIYLLELNSQLTVSVFSFCLPCLEKGKWPFDRTRIIQMYNDHCRVTSNIMFANAHLYTWVEKGTKNTTQCPQPGLIDLDRLDLEPSALKPWGHHASHHAYFNFNWSYCSVCVQ